MLSLSGSICLRNTPEWGVQRDDLRPGLRSFSVGRYVIIYLIDDEDVQILHVFHGHQDIESQLGE